MQSTQPTSRRCGRGFTLTEILVVIVLIILLLGLAVPAFNLMKGSRSIDGAENQVNALIGRARADAIGLQKPFGVLFFIDTSTSPTGTLWDGRVAVAEVMAADYPTATGANRDVYLDRVAETDFLSLPAGVIGFAFNNNENLGGAYLGYTTQLGASTKTSGTPLGGLILFDGAGQLITRTWGYVTKKSDGTTATQIAQDFGLPSGSGDPAFVDAGVPAANNDNAFRASLGFVLCDRQLLDGADTNKYLGGALSGLQQTYVNDNSAPLLVNRYNGTLIRAE